MKKYQFEEITMWFAWITFFLAKIANTDKDFLVVIFVVAALNTISAIYTALKSALKERKKTKSNEENPN